MAGASNADAHKLLEAQVSNLQSDHRQGNRKRKQDMPLPATHSNRTSDASDTVNHKPVYRVSDLKSDTKLSNAVQSVVETLNVSESLVLSCVMDMKNSGKNIDCTTLLLECDERITKDPSLQNYTREADTSDLSESREASVLTSTLPQSSQSVQTNVLLQATSKSSQLSSVQSTNSNKNLSATNSYHRNSVETEEHQANRYKCPVTCNRPTSQSAHDSSTMPSGQLSGFDCVDGVSILSTASSLSDVNTSKVNRSEVTRSKYPITYNLSASQSAHDSSMPSGQLTGFDCVDGASCLSTISSVSDVDQNEATAGSSVSSKSSLTEVTTSMRNMVSNLERQDPNEFTSRHHSGSSFNGQIRSGDSTQTQHVSTVHNNFMSSEELHTNNMTLDEHEARRNNSNVRERVLLQNTSNQKHKTDPEFIKTCFQLVEKENGLLEKSRLCSLCLSKPRDVTFLPCGHFTSCRGCAEPTYECPCCNKSILATVDTYLS